MKRRNVIRVGAAYLVAAWLVIQIVGEMIDILEIPTWIGKFLLMMLAVGFPLTLLFAWAFELTPECWKTSACDPSPVSPSPPGDRAWGKDSAKPMGQWRKSCLSGNQVRDRLTPVAGFRRATQADTSTD